MTSHTAVAIVQTVFYVPMVPIAIYVLRCNWSKGRPRMAWSPLVGFSLMRFAGGIVVILLQSNSNSLGLIISALVLLNVGLVPLIISTLGLIRTIIADSVEPTPQVKYIIKTIRIVIFIAISLLAIGGGLTGNANTIETGHTLTKIGYIVFAGILVVMAVMLLCLCHRETRSKQTSCLVYLLGSKIALPFLAVRTVYGLISAFNSDSLFSMWNPLFGSAILFALMALLPEYITLLIYLYLGFHRMRNAKELAGVNGDTSDGK